MWDFERFARPATWTSKDVERSTDDDFDPEQSNWSATTLVHCACMRKLRKNVHEKYTSLSLSLSLSHLLASSFSLALFHTDTHAHTRESKISLLASSWLSSRFPMRVKRNFLKLLDGSLLPSSFLKADSRMEANYSETTTRESPRSFWLLYFSGERFIPPVVGITGRIALSAEARIATGARSLARGNTESIRLFRYEVRGNYLS